MEILPSGPEDFARLPANPEKADELAAECSQLLEAEKFDLEEFGRFSRRMVGILGLLKEKRTPYIQDPEEKKVIFFRDLGTFPILHPIYDTGYRLSLGIYEEWEALPEDLQEVAKRNLTSPYAREFVALRYSGNTPVMVFYQSLFLPENYQVPKLQSYVTEESYKLFTLSGGTTTRYLSNLELRNLSRKIYTAWQVSQNQA